MGWFIEDATTICLPKLRLKGVNNILANIQKLPKELQIVNMNGVFAIMVVDNKFFDEHIYKRIEIED